MRLLDSSTPRRTKRRVGTWAALGALAVASLAGCASGDLRGDASTGWLPHGVTTDGPRITNLWIGAWIALLAVGVLVIGLILWSVVAYRRKADDNELPPQIRYNVPIEILYTVVPVFMIVVFFYYTARDESAIMDTSKKPDVTINVVGKQWSWDFNYIDADVHEAGTQAILTGKPGAEETIPTLYLPVDERVEFVLTSRDVIHSFWVPAFLKKQDMIPGRVNRFQVVPTQEGMFKGKCAELCGAYHSQMLFNVKVVSRADYDAHMQDLRAAGNDGLLPNSLNREPLMQGQDDGTGGGN